MQHFYTELHEYLSAAGVDGVKVDAQAVIGALGYRTDQTEEDRRWREARRGVRELRHEIFSRTTG